ncbi:hypothetical protein ACH5RR_011235 [Cinchona calisaya]|uniref:BAG domain-containing protein n=1 Tax=Cinchona calisaya TaxID=153742 RepID=A0ABD3A5R2_9GENT
MASHHHHHHHQCLPTTTTTTMSTVCYCCYCYPNDAAPRPLHHQPCQTNFDASYPNGPNLNPPYNNQNLNNCYHHQQPQHHPPPTDFEKEYYFQQLRHHQEGELTHTHPMVSSLVRRIAALESSLRRHYCSRSHSLRDAAARTIQTHFRAYLVRRSRTLRQLKDLASIKQILNSLKSSVSENTHFDPQSLSRKALKLLLKLDSIQGGDPMIRDGKKSICRELNGLLDLIDEIILKKSEISTRLVKKNNNFIKKSEGLNSDLKRGKNKRLEDLVRRIDALYTKVPEEEDDHLESTGISIIERNAARRNTTDSLGKKQEVGVEAKVKKSVSFVENGNVYKVHRSRYQRPEQCGSDDESSSNSVGAKGEGELDEYVRRKVEEVGEISVKETEEDHSDGESTKSCDGEGSPMYESRSEDGSFTFPAPLPVKMETRTAVIGKRSLVS